MKVICPKCKSVMNIDSHNNGNIKCPTCKEVLVFKSLLNTSSNPLPEKIITNYKQTIIPIIGIGLCCIIFLLLIFILFQATSKQTVKKNMKLEQIELESQIQKLSDTISEIQKEKKKKEKSITNLTEEKNNLEDNIEQLESTISGLQQTLRENNEDLKETKKRNEEQLQENNELKEKIKDLNNTIKELKTSAKYLKSKAIKAFENGYILEAKYIFQDIFKLHPECQEQDEYQKVYMEICDKIVEEKQKKDAEIAAYNAKLMEHITENYDKMTETSYYHTTRNCFYESGGLAYLLEPYMGIVRNSCFLRLKIAYIDRRGWEQRDWIFLEKIQLKGDNGVNIFIETKIWDNDGNVKMDYIIESLTQSIDNIVDNFENLTHANIVNVRFYGKNTVRDFEMTREQILAIKDILRLYYEKNK